MTIIYTQQFPLIRITIVNNFKKSEKRPEVSFVDCEDEDLSSRIGVQLTFPEFHFETEAKVDFPTACI